MKITTMRRKFAAIITAIGMAISALSVPVYAEMTESMAADNSNVSTLSTTSGDVFLEEFVQIAPGESRDFTFELTNWFGTDFTLIMIAKNSDGTTNGSLSYIFKASGGSIPCDGTARVYERAKEWSRGKHTITVYNNTSKTVTFGINVYES